ncbi:histone H1C-like [Neopsephotus bourkii]|uniref:histone H1C-like n=1 Tax=Neopsephotus bourkii TaxID=309878 RepID=UPI002AA53034|nr:histone H1C-like [Neopsephotus bourkii]
MPRGKVKSRSSTSSLPLPSKRGRLSLSDIIFRAVSFSAARRGTSLVAVKKILAAEGYDVRRNRHRLKAAVNSLIKKGLIERVTGSGASGSFRVGLVGKKQLDKNRRRGRAAGKSRRRRRRARKTKGGKRAVRATAQRVKKPSRPRGTAKAGPAAQNSVENAAGRGEEVAAAAAAAAEVAEAEVAVAEVAMEGAAGDSEAPGELLSGSMEQ